MFLQSEQESASKKHKVLRFPFQKKHYIVGVMKKSVLLGIMLLSASLVISCKSTRVEPAPDADDREIIQMAQTAYEKGHSDDAVYYYETVIKRFGIDTAVYTEARFEIAHIYLKEKKYDKAAPIYEEIIEIYRNTTPGTLKGAFQKLAVNDYAKIPESYKTKSE